MRDIGERAGVDQALIARYFGGKTQLNIAVLDAEIGHQVPQDLLHPGRVLALLDRVRQHGPGPVFQAAVQGPGCGGPERRTGGTAAPVGRPFLGTEHEVYRLSRTLRTVLGVLVSRFRAASGPIGSTRWRRPTRRNWFPWWSSCSARERR
ncbi:helix-turn-helix domain-containing protein [Streptomyces sp. NPDC001156]